MSDHGVERARKSQRSHARGKTVFCCTFVCVTSAVGVLFPFSYYVATLTSTPQVGHLPTICPGLKCAQYFDVAPDKLSGMGPCATRDRLLGYASTHINLSTLEKLDTNGCLRSYTFPRSIISKECAARVRCTSSLSNTIRNVGPVPCDNLDRTGGRHSRASICIFYLNYRNLENLLTSVKSHGMRSLNPDVVSHTVLTMDEDDGEVESMRRALRYMADVHRLTFPPEIRGGDPLPLALRLISLLSSCPLTVVSDSDAFMLADGWDSRLMVQFLDRNLSLFAANPRHSSHGVVFRDVAEWNWMAYRTQAFAGLVIGGGPVELPDVGHYYTQCAKLAGSSYIHLEGTMWPYAGKAATVVTEADGSPWILHLFYASRHNNEPDYIKSEARKYSLTDDQLAGLRENVTRTRCLDHRKAFGLSEIRAAVGANE